MVGGRGRVHALYLSPPPPNTSPKVFVCFVLVCGFFVFFFFCLFFFRPQASLELWECYYFSSSGEAGENIPTPNSPLFPFFFFGDPFL